MSLIEIKEIKITNAFNYKSNFTEEQKDILNDPTLNNEENLLKVNSITTASVTNDQKGGNILVNNSKENKKSIIKEIVIGTIGTVLGAVITYLIFGIK